MALIQAIREHRLVKFVYDGLARVVEPHTYGVLHDGREALSAHQVGGSSRSGNQPPWRLYAVDEITGLVVLQDIFHRTRPGYNPNDSRMETIYAAA